MLQIRSLRQGQTRLEIETRVEGVFLRAVQFEAVQLQVQICVRHNRSSRKVDTDLFALLHPRKQNASHRLHCGLKKTCLTSSIVVKSSEFG